MPSTPNKGYEVQVTGSNAGTWGDVLNDNMISYVDDNMGGVTPLSLSSSNVTLSASQARNAMLRLTGVLLANIQITSANIGFYFVENLTTGNFTVTVTNGVAGIVIAQSTRTTVFADASNGVRRVSGGDMPSGFKTTSFNTTAPLGWTTDATINNRAMRLVNTTGGSTGGSTGFTSVFSARTLVLANLPNVTLTTGSQNANHQHPVSYALAGDTSTSGGGSRVISVGAGGAGSGVSGIETTNHQHQLQLNGGVSQQSLDFGVLFVDALVVIKD